MAYSINLPFKQGNFEYDILSESDLKSCARFAAKLVLGLEPLACKLGLTEEETFKFLCSITQEIYGENLSLVVRNVEDRSIVGVSYIHNHFNCSLPRFNQQKMKPLLELKSQLVHDFHEYLETSAANPQRVAEWLLVAVDPRYKNQEIVDTIQEVSRHMLIQAGYQGLVMMLSSPLTQHIVNKNCYPFLNKTFSTHIDLDRFSYGGKHVFRNINQSLPMDYRWRGQNPSCEILYLNFHTAFPKQPPEDKLTKYSQLLGQVRSQKSMMLGKPGNMDFDFSGLAEVLQVFMNNSGHPFTPSSHRLDTKLMERELVYFFSKAYGLLEENTFGYVTSGGSEAMEYGLWTGFKKLDDPVVLLSEETHYAAFTILKKFNRPYQVIPCLDSGEMDYCELEKIVKKIKSPVLVIANIGSTMKGAIDDVGLIKSIVKDHEHYIHADAALHGAFLPFLPKFYEKHQLDLRTNICSLSISLHKFLGNITPAGLVITLKKNLLQEAYIEYIASENQTLSCSRSGLAVLLANYRLDAIGGEKGLREMAARCLSLSSYLLHSLEKLDIKARANEASNIVYFPSLPGWIATKWMLPNSKGVSHVVVMPHVTKELIDEFLEDVSLGLNS